MTATLTATGRHCGVWVTLPDAPARHQQAIEPEDGSIVIRTELPAGLFQLSALLDGGAFDWESLYASITRYENTGQRTGPWDFAIGTAHPVVPAYWIHLDGEDLGLWYMQRISVDDLREKRFRGRLAFWIDRAGAHELRLTPYRPMNVTWISALLEPDPDDTLEPLPPGLLDAPGRVSVSAWRTEEFWALQRRKLETTHATLAPAMHAVMNWTFERPPSKDPRASDALDAPLMIAAHHLLHRADAIERAMASIHRAVNQEHWGASDREAYQHNGDVGAASLMRCLAWSYHMLGDELDEATRQRILAKLRLQGNRFMRQILVTRDYWGGSVLQGHGWKTLWIFAAGVLNLLGVLPEARQWLTYLLPRLRRGLRAVPRDGAIPPSVYVSSNYLDGFILFRDTLLELAGPDLLDELDSRPIIDYITTVIRPETNTLRSAAPQDDSPIFGCHGFFARVAMKHADERAAWLFHRQVNTPPPPGSTVWHAAAHRHAMFWGFFAYDPAMPASQPPNRPHRHLAHFPDSAVVHFRDDAGDVTSSLRCGPWCGYHAYRHATGPCDRMGVAPTFGHFNLFRGNREILATPAGGYRLHTNLGSCLLIDDAGQINDVGYPMSIPAWRDHGAEITAVRWDGNTGIVRMNLQPAYPANLGVMVYQRQLVLNDARSLVCRDHVVLDRPRELAWLFQFRQDVGAEQQAPLQFRIGGSAGATLELRGPVADWQSTVRPTDVVYPYSGERARYQHVRFQPVNASSSLLAEFVITW